MNKNKLAITLTTTVGFAALILFASCTGSNNSAQSAQEKQSDPRVTPHHTESRGDENPQYPSDQAYKTVKGYQIPIVTAPTLSEAIEKAKIILGPKSHGYLIWNDKIYNFEGQEVKLD